MSTQTEPVAMNREQVRLYHNAIRAHANPGSMSLLVGRLLQLHRPEPIHSRDKAGPQFCRACPTHDGEYQPYPCDTTAAMSAQLGVEVRGTGFVEAHRG